jgi:hypothetical protein
MHAEEMLVGFDGMLQVDSLPATIGCKGLTARAALHCGSPNGRREVIKAIPEAGSPVGDEILQRIAGLYVIEKQTL